MWKLCVKTVSYEQYTFLTFKNFVSITLLITLKGSRHTVVFDSKLKTIFFLVSIAFI